MVTSARINPPGFDASPVVSFDRQRATMPRYYFNVVEGNDSGVINDTEGVVLSSQRVARKKAIGLARDILRDGLVPEPIENWKIVVRLRNGVEVLTIPLSRTRARSLWTLLHPRQLVHRF
jgi:hypothetical protein